MADRQPNRNQRRSRNRQQNKSVFASLSETERLVKALERINRAAKSGSKPRNQNTRRRQKPRGGKPKGFKGSGTTLGTSAGSLVTTRTAKGSNQRPHSTVQKLSPNLLARFTECQKNYLRILANPTKPVKGSWCSIVGEKADVVPWQHIGRINVLTDSTGSALVLFNCWVGSSDGRAISYSNGLAAFDSVNFNPSGAGMTSITLNQLGYTTTQLNSIENPIRARLVAAGICLSPMGNAMNTQGQIYTFTSSNNRPTAYSTGSTGSIGVVAAVNNPMSTLQLNGCYLNNFLPKSQIQKDFQDGTLAANPFRPTNTISSDGWTHAIYVTGLQIGAGYTFLLEYGSWWEYDDPIAHPNLVRSSEENEDVGDHIVSLVSNVKGNTLNASPGNGFLDAVVSGGKALVNIAEKIPGVGPVVKGIEHLVEDPLDALPWLFGLL